MQLNYETTGPWLLFPQPSNNPCHPGISTCWETISQMITLLKTLKSRLRNSDNLFVPTQPRCCVASSIAISCTSWQSKPSIYWWDGQAVSWFLGWNNCSCGQSFCCRIRWPLKTTLKTHGVPGNDSGISHVDGNWWKRLLVVIEKQGCECSHSTVHPSLGLGNLIQPQPILNGSTLCTELYVYHRLDLIPRLC